MRNRKFKSWIGKLPKTRKMEMRKYWKSQEVYAKKFKMSAEDLHNLLDVFYICIHDEQYEDLKTNRLKKWFDNFFDRIERICIPELYDKKYKKLRVIK